MERLKEEVAKPCSRCIMTIIDQQKSDRNQLKEPLRIGTFRQFSEQGVMFGESYFPQHSGTLSIGDRLEVLAVRH